MITLSRHPCGYNIFATTAMALTLTLAACAGDAGSPIGPGSAVVPPPELAASDLKITAFRVIEHQYPGSPTWYYAPLLTLQEVTGGNAVRVIGVGFEIPGLPGIPRPAVCRVIAAGTSVEMFREIYGDYEFVAFSPGGARATGEPASAMVSFTDSRGTTRTVQVTGPVVSGSLPTTYSGGQGSNNC